jgi:hypothetical protein
MDLTSRAVAYESVAIVEHRLHQLAHEPWLASSKFEGRKRIEDVFDARDLGGDAQLDALARLKEVSDENFDDVRKLIEGHFAFRFEDLDGWSELVELRDIVNSLKHRRGARNWKRHRKTGWPKNLLERDDLDFDKAAKAIEDVRRFLAALECAVERSAKPGSSSTRES